MRGPPIRWHINWVRLDLIWHPNNGNPNPNTKPLSPECSLSPISLTVNLLPATSAAFNCFPRCHQWCVSATVCASQGVTLIYRLHCPIKNWIPVIHYKAINNVFSTQKSFKLIKYKNILTYLLVPCHIFLVSISNIQAIAIKLALK